MDKDKYIIAVPEVCLVALIGASSSGKTSFANRYFKPTEVLSSDFFRAMVCDDEGDQSCSGDAFELLYFAARKRLNNMKLTVIDATSVQAEARKKIIDLAREQNVHAAAIVLDLPFELLKERNCSRADRNYPERVISGHCRDLKRSLKNLKREGFRFVYIINSLEQLDKVEITRTKLWNDKREEHGPFDIIGDIHGCGAELESLLEKLGYRRGEQGVYAHPEGRKAAFLGDFCDRGPRSADVLRLVMDMVGAGQALAVPGNHDVKLLKYLRGQKITVPEYMLKTVAELEARGEAFKAEAAAFIDGLVSHYVLDGGRLAIAHAGIKQEYLGRASARVREFCLYGDITGETDGMGLPVRLDWAADYRGRTAVVYGHIANKEVRQLNGTVGIDTGCVFGGQLTAYRWPEREIVSVPAREVYFAPVKPLDRDAEEETSLGDMLTADDFQKKLYITTALLPAVNISENNAAAALEAMSRFAADPHWLIYLPPTMSPCETSTLDGYLEYPEQAFAYYSRRGIKRVICERKHMGSRAVVVLCRSAEAARRRFGAADGSRGIVYTRTGRRFFEQQSWEDELLTRLQAVLTASDFWRDFRTDWVCLDAELMPWSEKAQSLLQSQYAPAGRAGLDGLTAAAAALEETCKRGNCAFDVDALTSGQNVDPAVLLERFQRKLAAAEGYVRAYEEYCWKVESPDDLRLAPFHLLASEGRVFGEESHLWHMETLKKYVAGRDEMFPATPYLPVDTEDQFSLEQGVRWWLALTSKGGEGMVVKPEMFTAKRGSELLQPAVKCRGREYLRIIYGPEYLEPEHLERLKKRSLRRKRALALQEFALGLEALKRFTEGAPLYKVHECVFGVLALESEPVDPRL